MSKRVRRAPRRLDEEVAAPKATRVAEPETSERRDEHMEEVLTAIRRLQGDVDLLKDRQTSMTDVSGGEKGKCDTDKNLKSLCSHVNDKLKQKVWDQKYVEMASLLPKKAKEATVTRISWSAEDAIEVSRAPPSSVDKLNIQEWQQAWNIFQAIMGSNPNTKEYLPALLVHGECVLKLAREGGKWGDYDTEFRRQVESGEACFGQIDDVAFHGARMDGLRDRVLNKHLGGDKGSKPPGPSSSPPNKPAGTVPPGYCFQFHTMGKCTVFPCKFNHRCWKCSGEHRGRLCTSVRE